MECGTGPAADTYGNFYVTIDNGTFNAQPGGTNYGMCLLKFSTTNNQPGFAADKPDGSGNQHH
ncbi:MAG TPA: hypothetical protein VG077_06770 [Verrucomicrobiae bacterium]|nr:hypothetical protein [Verrucomicrobiae bacterium]